MNEFKWILLAIIFICAIIQLWLIFSTLVDIEHIKKRISGITRGREKDIQRRIGEP